MGGFRKKGGKPREDVSIRFDRRLKEQAQQIVSHRRTSLAEYLSELARPVIERDFARTLAELAAGVTWDGDPAADDPVGPQPSDPSAPRFADYSPGPPEPPKRAARKATKSARKAKVARPAKPGKSARSNRRKPKG